MLKSLVGQGARRLLVGQPTRSILRAMGYDVIQRSRFGYDAFLDIQRFDRVWMTSVKSFFDVGANDGRTYVLALTYLPIFRTPNFCIRTSS